MLSIKGWAVIKTHFFYLNECKLAHLLWWASCPDSSISMIDQLSSCWWLSGNGSCSGDGCRGGGGGLGRIRDERAESRKKNDRKWSKSFIQSMGFFIWLDCKNTGVLIQCFFWGGGLSCGFLFKFGSKQIFVIKYSDQKWQISGRSVLFRLLQRILSVYVSANIKARRWDAWRGGGRLFPSVC